MTERTAPIALACPRCDHAPLPRMAGDGCRCERCGAQFPLIGGIPWLFAEPQVALAEWCSRVATTLGTLRHDAARLATAAQSTAIGALTRRRLRRLAEANEGQGRRLERLLTPLAVGPHAASYETNLAFRAAAPWDQGLMTYAYNVHRDWSWGEAENEASFAIVRDHLGGASPRRVLVLGRRRRPTGLRYAHAHARRGDGGARLQSTLVAARARDHERGLGRATRAARRR